MRKPATTALYQRALVVGRMFGLGAEAYDFAGWLFLEWLEGRKQHQRIEHSLIEYIRATRGDPRSGTGRERLHRERTMETFSPTPEKPLGIDIPVPDPDPVLIRIADLGDLARFLTPREAQLMRWVYSDGLTMAQAGIVDGVSESRVSQMISVCILKIKRGLYLKK